MLVEDVDFQQAQLLTESVVPCSLQR